MRRRFLGVLLLAAAAASGPGLIARGADRILTFGGGPTPEQNQTSLEKNVIYFQSVLNELHLNGVPHDIYFADGLSKNRTVQYRTAPEADDERLNLVASIYSDDADSIGMRFRASAIPHLAGPSTTAAIDNWFDTARQSLAPRDHLLIYFTGHGGQERKHPRNTELFTWTGPGMTVQDFVSQLDKINPATEVTLVMVQCHSGGFANVIYQQGDPARGLSRHQRCGFFSTIASRPAAGCTPDIDEEDYQEFSTSFFAALSGKSRTGKPVARPDYDAKGATSFTDAFTYVLLTSDTIDIPMTTSDQFLRDNSRFRTKKGSDLLAETTAYSTILGAATPAQKAALEGLAAQLKVTGEDRVAVARAQAEGIEHQRKTSLDEQRAAEKAANEARQKIKETLGLRWPEFDIPWHPQTAALLAGEGAAVQQAIETHGAYQAFIKAQERQGAAADKDLTLERHWAKLQRFIRLADTVILAANLSRVASGETVAAYRELVARENQTLTAWHAP